MPLGVLTREQLDDVVAAYLEFDEFVFDVETFGEYRLDPQRNEIFWISMAGPGRADVLPCGHPIGERIAYAPGDALHRISPQGKHQERRVNPDSGREKWFDIPEPFTPAPKQLWVSEVAEALTPLMFSERRKVGHNVKFDLESIAKYYGGKVPPPPYGDTLVVARLVNENHLNYSLGQCVKRAFGFEYDKSKGKKLEVYPYSEAYEYSYLDAKYGWLLWQKLLPLLDREEVRHIFDMEMDLLPVLIDMEMVGACVDVNGLFELHREFATEMARRKIKINTAAGYEINLNANRQVAELVYDTLGHECIFFTEKTHERQVTKEALEACGKDKVVQAILEYQRYHKLQSTFVEGLINSNINGRIHPDFNQMGAVSGRLSCVAGSTLLPTSRGVFQFDEYLPQEGDRVLTHRGRWQPVVRKLFKGYQEMYRVGLFDGSILLCTMDHKLLTPLGWREVRELKVGDEVYGDGGFSALRERSKECNSCASVISGQEQTNDRNFGRTAGHYITERSVHCAEIFVSTGIENRTGSSVLTLEAGPEEPYVGQEWFPASQFQRSRVRWSRLFTKKDRRQIHLCASIGLDESIGLEEMAQGLWCASHRREQDQQRSEQFGSGDEFSSQKTPWKKQCIREITSVGSMGVWDIEVEKDHSYVAQGFLNHNCRNPNLQNQPSRSEIGKKIRQVFVASPGYDLIVIDLSQIELRVLAHFTKDPNLLRAYRKNEDLHGMTAAKVFGPEYTDIQRSYAKNANFCVPLSTEALTREGWKSVDSISVGDLVLGYHSGSEKLTWTPVEKVMMFESAPLVEIRNNHYSAITTPNHRWVGEKRRQMGHRGPRFWHREEITTDGICSEHRIFLSAPLWADSSLPVHPSEAALIAWLWTDGSIIRGVDSGAPSQSHGKKVKFQATIFQSKNQGISQIQDLLAELGVRYRHSIRPPVGERNPIHCWSIDPEFMRDLWWRAGLDEITPEQFVLRLGTDALQAFTTAAWQAEGWCDRRGAKILAQNEGPIYDALVLAVFLTGHHAQISSNGFYRGVQNLNIRFGKPYVNGTRLEKTQVGSAPVWCVKTELGSWVMRQGHQISLTGNSILFGAGPGTLVRKYGVPTLRMAKALLEAFYAQNREVKIWKFRTVRKARDQYDKKNKIPPYVTTILGRKRRLPELFWPDDTRRSAAERQVVSVRVSGTAADIFKLMMIECHRVLKEQHPDAHILITVHDELVIEAPEKEAKDVLALVKKTMESTTNPQTGEPILSVPIVAEGRVCKSWAEKSSVKSGDRDKRVTTQPVTSSKRKMKY